MEVSAGEMAWAAGLFEGEGCLAYSNGQARLQLKMIHEESVRRIHAAVGVGQVYGPYGPYASQLGDKPTFMWVVTRGDEVVRAIELLRPHMSEWAAKRLDRTADERIGDVRRAVRKPVRRRPPEGADPDDWLS